MGIIAELRRRNVFRVGIAYLVLAWVIIQVTDVAVPALRLPEWVPSLIFFFGAIGFPFALFFAWAFELTPEGIKREHEVDRSESITHITGRKFDFAIIGLLVVALGFVVWDAYLSDPGEIVITEGPADAVEPAPVEETSKATASIAVLPFADMSADKDQEYMSDGIAEELLNLLAKIPALRVAARTSAFSFKNKDVTISEIGVQLNVAYVLEGSVRKAGNQIRITAQLIDASSDTHLWSETYTRTRGHLRHSG